MLKNLLVNCLALLNPVNRAIPKKNIILLYSNLGFRDNVRAFYDYLIENGAAARYTIVCSLNDYKHQHAVCGGVKFVSPLAGFFYFFRAKICCYCFGKFPVKPSAAQTVVNFTHGMPIKTLGNTQRGNENADYCFFTYVLATSEFYRGIIKRCFGCAAEQVAVCGMPRTDALLSPASEPERDALFRALGTAAARLIVWLPTFRQTDEPEVFPLCRAELEALNGICKAADMLLLIKPHPLSVSEPALFAGLSHISMKPQAALDAAQMSLYRLIKYSAALITDYSSVYLDYLLLDRPVAFMMRDFSEYASGRGFVLENPLSYLAGDRLEGAADLSAFISGIAAGADAYAAQRRQVCAVMNAHTDGQSCARVAALCGIELPAEEGRADDGR
ncbi:MAG: CDP-glycerol glycerophosphotransferase family protein [Oscillospiraceae bacterium]